MFNQKSKTQLQVIDNTEYEVMYAEPEQEAPSAQRNGFVEMGKMSFAAAFGASLGWWLGEFVAGLVKVVVVVGLVVLAMWIKS
jgi:hypothetical protein